MRMLSMLVLCVVSAILVACEETEQPFDSVRTARNLSVLKKCERNWQICQGGYAKYVGEGRIVRLTSDRSSDHLVLSYAHIAGRTEDAAKRFEWVVLPYVPSNGLPTWDDAALQYAMQFVINPNVPY